MLDPSHHWIFGDQLGPHFTRRGATTVMIESKAVFRRRRFHRAKAHLVLSAMRHRAAELGGSVRYVRAETYKQGLREVVGDAAVTVHHPTSHAALAFVQSLKDVEVLPPGGFLVQPDDFAAWSGRQRGRRLLMENFYRHVRREHDLLMNGDEPVGGRWNMDADNREPPPRGSATLPVPHPYRPREDAIDEEVRDDLDAWAASGEVTFVGRDGPRLFPATRAEALRALHAFVDRRLATFGRWEDAMLAGDWAMSHSLLSAPLNLGLLHPAECVEAAETACRAGRAPLNAVEGFVRQIAGWREYMWNTYWHFGPDYRRENALGHHGPLPDWFVELDADAVQARCLSTVLGQLRDRGWVHHIPRLMVLGNWALQQGWQPAQVTDWFHRSFVDGYDWVMLPNVVGMSQYADGGRIVTKPYTAGGAYIHKMSDLCGPCRYRPNHRTGDDACPYTTGYWRFVHRHRDRLAHNHRTARQVHQMNRLTDLDHLLKDRRHTEGQPP